MKKGIVWIFLLILISNVQCKKNAARPSIDVSKITSTDMFGNILTADNTDWQTDDQWTDDEQQLFKQPDTTALAGTERSVLSLFPAYPNPLINQQAMQVRASKPCVLEMVITDNHLEIKKRYTIMVEPPSLNFVYMFDQSVFSNKTNYRLYYAFYSLSDGIFARGHGDIKINR